MNGVHGVCDGGFLSLVSGLGFRAKAAGTQEPGWVLADLGWRV